MINNSKDQEPDKLIEIFGEKSKDFDKIQDIVAELIYQNIVSKEDKEE
tara:strand:- start:540 stop:683 length:144 start_codon:yes stop_codon:yes gene_type:complete